MADAKPIGITQLIDRIKDDLQQAQRDIPIFKIKQVELEIAFTVEDKKDGGIEIHILKAGVERTNANVQSIKIMMEMLNKDEIDALNLSPAKKMQVAEVVEEIRVRKAVFGEES